MLDNGALGEKGPARSIFSQRRVDNFANMMMHRQSGVKMYSEILGGIFELIFFGPTVKQVSLVRTKCVVSQNTTPLF